MLILHRTYVHWSVAVLTVTEHFIYSHFNFFQIGCFLHWIQSVYPICFVLFMITDFPYICDHQVCYSAGGYSLSPSWFLTRYIYLFSQDCHHSWVQILHKTYDHWSVAVLTVTECFIYSHFWFFSNWLPSTLNSIWLPPFVLFSLWWWIFLIFVITKCSNLILDIYCIRRGSWLGISIHFFRTGCIDVCWYCTKPTITGL